MLSTFVIFILSFLIFDVYLIVLGPEDMWFPVGFPASIKKKYMFLPHPTPIGKKILESMSFDCSHSRKQKRRGILIMIFETISWFFRTWLIIFEVLGLGSTAINKKNASLHRMLYSGFGNNFNTRFLQMIKKHKLVPGTSAALRKVIFYVLMICWCIEGVNYTGKTFGKDSDVLFAYYLLTYC